MTPELLAWLLPWVKHVGSARVETNFYKCTRPYYRRHLMQRHREVADRSGYHLEHAFVSALVEGGFHVFSTGLCYVGRSGTTGRLYRGGDYSGLVKAEALSLISEAAALPRQGEVERH